jgi:hypothetical protein
MVSAVSLLVGVHEVKIKAAMPDRAIMEVNDLTI